MIKLNAHDSKLFALAVAAIETAIANAKAPAAVVRKIAAVAVRHRNKGRLAAKGRLPFNGTCAVSGRRLDERDAVLDEMDPHKGYKGPCRWICAKANKSGLRSCGDC